MLPAKLKRKCHFISDSVNCLHEAHIGQDDKEAKFVLAVMVCGVPLKCTSAASISRKFLQSDGGRNTNPSLLQAQADVQIPVEDLPTIGYQQNQQRTSFKV